MRDTLGNATTDFRASLDGRGAPASGGWLALLRRLCAAALPAPVGQRAGRTGHRDCPPAGLRRPDRARGDPRLQRRGAGGPPAGLAPPPHGPRCLRCGPSGAPACAAAPEPADLRQAEQCMDAGVGGPGQLRARPDARTGQWRDHPRHPEAFGRGLEAGQALAGQSRSGVRPEKSARDRLIRLASTHPAWALGFQDETWWSRLARPALHAWAEPDQPLRLVEQTVAKDDPDPKALACYGLLVRWAPPEQRWHEEAWLRFVEGRPVSALTTQYLAWCCAELQALGKQALLLVWDNAPWHVSHEVRR